jgi:chromosome segregation ATPase
MDKSKLAEIDKALAEASTAIQSVKNGAAGLLSDAEEQIGELTRLDAQSRQNIEGLEGELLAAKAELESSAAKGKEAEELAKQLQAETNRAQEAEAALTGERAKRESAIETEKNRADELEKQLAASKKEFAEAMKNFEALNRQVTILRKQVEKDSA